MGVVADLPGPKVRTGSFPEGGIELATGGIVSLAAGDGSSSGQRVCVDYPDLLADLDVGDRLMIGDGGITLRVISATGWTALAEVENGGRVQGRPGVHLAAADLTLRAPTDEDLDLAEQVARAGVDFIALSFVRAAADVTRLRAVVGDRARVMVKIETAEALADLPSIAAAADAVMVARGDLGLDCPLEDVPHLQKQIVRHCVEAGIPVVTATQMLESMITARRPTRAEVSDVANAVFDGTDAVMLSGETAIGHDPALVVRTMASIAGRAEAHADYRAWGRRLGRVQKASEPAGEPRAVAQRITDSITHAAWQAADDVGAVAIVCCTRSGRVARAMARYRPLARVIAISPDPACRNALTLSWGVEPVATDEVRTTDEMVWLAVEKAVAGGVAHAGDTVVVIAGAPDRSTGAVADVMRIVQVR